MLRKISVFSLLILISFTSHAASQQNQLPRRIQANYEVTKNGQLFANVHEVFVVTGRTYKVESITKGIGIYALLGERQLTSHGEVTTLGLKPQRFELHQGDSAKKTLIADFNWANNALHMTVKGVVKDVALSLGTQDLASYAYQFMFLSKPLKDTLSLTMTTGKKLSQYVYKISEAEEILEISGAQYKTLHLIQMNQNSLKTDTKDLWLGVDQQYVPVKIIMIDDKGQKLEQTLTEFYVE